MAQIVVKFERHIVKRLKLKNEQTVIGRGRDCDITLPDRTVSLRHAIIHCKENSFRIQDLDSTNGTSINYRFESERQLNDGDQIAIGKYSLLFRSTLGLARQIHKLTLSPNRQTKHQSRQAQLEVLNGKRRGEFIAIEREKLVLGGGLSNKVVVERNQVGDFLLHTRQEQKLLHVIKLNPGTVFSVGDINLRFHNETQSNNL